MKANELLDSLEDELKRLEIELDAWRRQRNSLAKENVKMRKVLKLCHEAFYRWNGECPTGGHWSQLYDAKKAVNKVLSTDCQSKEK